MKKIHILFIAFSFLLIPFLSIQAVAGTLDNIGFIQRNIWYSQDPFSEGDTITIHTVVFNSGAETVTGVVEFYDQNVILGKQNFTIEAGVSKDVSIDWNVSAGDHVISAKIVDSEIILAQGQTEPTTLEFNETEEDNRFVPKTIVSEEGDTLDNEITETIEDVQDFIKEKTPDIVEEKIAEATSSIDEWREGTAFALEDKIEEVKLTLSQINADETQTDAEEDGLQSESEIKNKFGTKNALEKPFTYIKLWFLKLLSFIFNHKILFYITIALLAYFILRLIWRKVF